MAHQTMKLALIGSLALLVGCNNASEASSTTAPTTVTTTSIASTTTTTAPTTTITTSTTTSTTTTTLAPTPTISIPAGVPSQDEIINIVNEWNRRINAMYAAPDINTVNELCVPNSGCSAEYTAQISDLIGRGGHVEVPPPTVGYLRSAAPSDNGGFIVSYWTAPLGEGILLSPSETLKIPATPDGLGDTLIFEPYPTNTAFPWRVSDQLSDPG